MIQKPIPVGSPVQIRHESEHFPGEVVWIVDSMPEEEYAYCVSRHRFTDMAAKCEWVKANHVSAYRVPSSPLATKSKVTSDSIEIGDYVVVSDEQDYTITPNVGYVSEIDQNRVGITHSKAGETDILIKRQFVRHV